MASGKIEPHPQPAVEPWHLWEEVRREHGARTALWQADGTPGLTFDSLGRRAEGLGDWLRRQWSEENWPGRVVALGVEENADWLAALLALWQGGAVVLLTGPVQEPSSMSGVLRDSGAAGLLRTAADGSLLWEPAYHEAVEPVRLPPHTVLLKMTSGTGSTPRLLAFTTAQLRADLRQILSGMGLGPEDRNLGLLPWSHSYGFSNLVTPLLWAGVPMVVTKDPWPAALAQTLLDSAATIWPTVPALLPGLLQTGFVGTPSLRLVISAGAPLSASLAANFLGQTGLAPRSFYGSSECGGIAFDRTGRAASLEGWVGPPLPGVRLDFSSVQDAVIVRGETVSSGLVPAREGDELTFGAFTLPDILCWEDGGLRLLGRRDDVLNIGGRKVHPQAVETVLRDHPGVADCVVFGTPHPGGGDRVSALLVARQARLPDSSLRAWCEERLPSWQVPRAFHWVDQLPFNERGKLSRTQLRAAWS
jgi:long-chain acyl-CoA synthetase